MRESATHFESDVPTFYESRYEAAPRPVLPLRAGARLDLPIRSIYTDC